MRAAAAGSRLRRPCNGIDVTVHLTLLGARRMVVRLRPVTSCFVPKLGQVVLVPEFTDFRVGAGFGN